MTGSIEAKGAGTDGYRLATALIILLFPMWGMAHNLNDILVAQFRRAFDLGDLGSSLVQSAFYIAYLLTPIPMALYMQRFGFKATVLLGLGLYAVGALLFWPASHLLTYGAFLGALFVIACGISCIETSGLGLVLVTSPPDRAEFRVQLASAFNPVGSVLGILIGRQFIFSGEEASTAQRAAMSAAQLQAYRAGEAQAVQIPYIVIGCAVAAVAVLIAATRFPPAASERQEGRPLAGLASLFRTPFFMAGVVAQFFYVGVQVGTWSFIIRYAQEAQPGLTSRGAAIYLTLSLVALVIGRFASLPLLRRWSSPQIAMGYAAIGAVLSAVAVLLPGPIGIGALVAVSLFMSVMYPAIYTTALHDQMHLAKPASALITMAIVGGAVLTAAMGALSDATGSIANAYIVPMIGFLVVLAYARWAVKRGIGDRVLAVAH